MEGESPAVIALPRPLVRGGRGVVACAHPLAAGCGRDVLELGGGAVDAAVAAAFALAVLLPDACGLGGDALALVRTPHGEVRAYNGSGAAPAALDSALPADGGGTVAVPGFVHALADLHGDHGTLPLPALVAPAVRLARDGFAAGEELLAAVERQRARLERGGRGWPLLTATRAGARVQLPRLAEVLEQIGGDGPTAFYRGEFAEAIAAAVRGRGGRLGAADLAAHETVVLAPVVGGFAGATLWLQPPVSQALLALLVLRGLEPFRSASARVRVHAGLELTRAAFAHRDLVALPDAAARLLGLELEFDLRRATHGGEVRAAAHTAAVTAADASGRVVSMLVSVFDEFGSAVLVPEGDFVLNDRLLGFSRDAGSPNAVRPSTRPVHTLSPALVEHDGAVFALATPGADGQVQFLAQLVEGIVGRETAVEAALAAPRWRVVGAETHVEAGFPADVAAELERLGHVLEWRPAGDRVFGAACVSGIDLAAGTVFAATDPRREVWAAAC